MSRLSSRFGSMFRRSGSTLVTQGLLFPLAILCLLLASAPAAMASSGVEASFILPQAIGFSSSEPQAVAVNAAGDVFVADNSTSAIYEIVAVNGAVSASSTVKTIHSNIGQLYGVALDKSGDLFFSGSVSGKVGVYEIVASSGVLSSSTTPTLIDSFSAPQGITVNASGDLFVAAWTAGVYEIPATSGAVVPLTTPIAVGSGFSGSTGVAVDASGDVFVADYESQHVYEIVASSGVVSTSSTVNQVGSGFGHPIDVAVDGLGDVFVADAYYDALYEVVAVSGAVSSTSTVNKLYTASVPIDGIALDGNGNIFAAVNGQGVNLADSAVYEISTRSFNFGSVNVGGSSTQTLTFTITSGGTLGAPQVLTQGAPNLDFTDAGTGTCTTTPTQSTGATCTVVVKFAPKYAGTRYGAVNLVNSSGAVIATANLYGTGTGPQVAFSPGTDSVQLANSTVIGGEALLYPAGVAVDGAGDVYIADLQNNRVVEVTPAGKTSVLSTGSLTAPSGSLSATALYQPLGVAVDGAGDVYIADQQDNRVVEVTAAGVASVVSTGSLGSPQQSLPGGVAIKALVAPSGVAVDGAGDLYIADTGDSRVVEVTAAGVASVLSTGSLTAPSGSSCTTTALCFRRGVAVDGAGDVYIADTSNNRVVEVTAAGVASVLSTGSLTAPSGSSCTTTALCQPHGIAVDGAGDVYIADTYNNRVVEVTATGVASVLSTGSLTAPSGSSCTTTALCGPQGVAVDGAGDVYIADTENNRVVEINQSQQTLSFASTNVGSTSSDSPQNVTVQNIGNQPLTFTALSTATTGQTTSSFNLNGSGTTCTDSTSLNAGESCELGVEFLPTVGGSLAGTVNLTDNSLNAVAPNNVQQISLSGTAVDIVITPSSLSSGVINTAYTSVTFSASGGAAPYTWRVSSSSLPSGMSLSSAGVLSGTPTTAGQFPLTIKVRDANNFEASQNYTLTILPVAPAITTTSLPDAVWGVSYSQSIAATGTSLTWSVVSGSLPAGLSLNSSTGLLSGTPTAVGKSTFTIQVEDSYNQIATQQLTLTVDAVTPTITSLTPPTATAGGSAFTMTVNGTGFDANSVVNWGATALATTYVSSTQLTAQVTTAAITTAGAYNVTATSSSGTTSSAYQFEVDTANSTSSNEPTIATATATVTAGSTASFAVTVPSTTTISSIACLNLPTGATCSYSSSTNTVSIATTSTTPKGTYQITVVFTETVAGAASAGIFLPFLLLPLWFLRRKLKIQGAWITACMALAILAGTLLATTGCGGGSSSSSQTSPATSSSVVTLTVQ